MLCTCLLALIQKPLTLLEIAAQEGHNETCNINFGDGAQTNVQNTTIRNCQIIGVCKLGQVDNLVRMKYTRNPHSTQAERYEQISETRCTNCSAAGEKLYSRN